MDLVKSKSKKTKRVSNLLALAFDGSRLEGVVMRRPNGSLQTQQTFSVSLSLDPLTADPELVGREIRNHLDSAGVRERDCAVALPLRWVLTSHVDVPPLPEADIAGFLQLEAERSFHSDISTLHFAASRSKLAEGKQHALLVGVPKTHLVRLEHVLRAAKLRLLSFSLGLPALQSPLGDTARGLMALAIGETSIGLEIVAGGGVTALRAIEGALENEGGRRVLQVELVAREVRITLGQLPPELRESIKAIRIFGPRDLAQQLADALELRLEPLGLRVEVVTKYAPREFGLDLPAETAVSPATSMAASYLAGRRPAFELLLPRVSAWQQFSNRYASGKLRLAGMAGGAVALLVIAGFVWQQVQLNSLRSQWGGLAPKHKQLKDLQAQIRLYRPWYDNGIRGLSILSRLTSAFPDTGIVSAKTVEIRDLNLVTCTGIAQDQQSLLRTLELLRKQPNIGNVKDVTIRGNKPPLNFTFNFQWVEGGNGAN
jgi:hypothetical protein